MSGEDGVKMKIKIGNRRIIAVIAVLLTFVVVSGCSGRNDSGGLTQEEWQFYNARGELLIFALANRDYDGLNEMFSPDFAEILGETGLQDVWEQKLAILGEFVEIHEVSNVVTEGRFRSDFILRHNYSGMVLRIYFDAAGRILGLDSEEFHF